MGKPSAGGDSEPPGGRDTAGAALLPLTGGTAPAGPEGTQLPSTSDDLVHPCYRSLPRCSCGGTLFYDIAGPDACTDSDDDALWVQARRCRRRVAARRWRGSQPLLACTAEGAVLRTHDAEYLTDAGIMEGFFEMAPLDPFDIVWTTTHGVYVTVPKNAYCLAKTLWQIVTQRILKLDTRRNPMSDLPTVVRVFCFLFIGNLTHMLIGNGGKGGNKGKGSKASGSNDNWQAKGGQSSNTTGYENQGYQGWPSWNGWWPRAGNRAGDSAYSEELRHKVEGYEKKEKDEMELPIEVLHHGQADEGRA